MLDRNLYKGREQTLIKHYILENYLERFSRIIGYAGWATITYVDCFSGPWEARTEDYRDTSFGIALRVLRETRDELRANGRDIKLRCFFLEKDPTAYARLATYVDRFDDVDTTHRNKELESAVDDILRFVQGGGPNAFPFIFIDPTGWTGFALERIRPLLQLRPGEVLINFMTDYIRRFVDAESPETREGFTSMFGESVQLESRSPQEREDELIRKYMVNVKKAGRYEYVGAAIVFKPEIEKTNFHLVYGTRGEKGIEKFKEVERKAMSFTEELRAESKRAVDLRRGQSAFLSAVTMYPFAKMRELRRHYLERANNAVQKRLAKKKQISYRDLWQFAVQAPLVWPSDVRKWVLDWREAGVVSIEGMKPRQRNPQNDNVIVWLRETP